MRDEGEVRSAERLLRDGWNSHGEEAEHVAQQLEALAGRDIAAEHVAPLIHLSVHVVGEHLGDWPRALRLGKRILHGRVPTAQTARAWGRLSIAAAFTGDAVEAAELELSCLAAVGDDVAPTLLDMRLAFVNALIGAKRLDEGSRLYRRVLDLASRIRQSPLVDRTMAVASNNIAWEIYESSLRTADDDALMRLSADTAHEYWLRCGDWVNEQRALYLKAVVANATGDPRSALANANAALAIIAANTERPLDAARLHLARAVSLVLMGDGDAAAALDDADAAASAPTVAHLRAQYVDDRARAVADLSRLGRTIVERRYAGE